MRKKNKSKGKRNKRKRKGKRRNGKRKECTSLMFEEGKVAAFSSLRLREEGPMLRSSTGGRSLRFSFLSLQMNIGRTK